MKCTMMVTLLVSAAYAQTTPPPTCSLSTNTAPAASPASSGWDTSGNTMLTGSGTPTRDYNFRYVQYSVADPQGDLSHAVALYGTITFTSASGSYKITGTLLDSSSPYPRSTSCSGTYSIAAAGFGFLSNPLSPNDSIWGLVSRSGEFVGSTTETKQAFNDLFIAAPTTPLDTNASLQGAYSVGYMNFPDGYVQDIVTAGFQIAPDGNGNIGAVNIQMYRGTGSNAIDVTERASYGFSGGVGVLSFPNDGEAIERQKVLYISPDGNFIFGGDNYAFDLFVGIRTEASVFSLPTAAGGGTVNFAGLYYQAGIDEIITPNPGGNPSASLQTYYGAFNASPAFGAFNPASGVILGHQRILAPLRSSLQPTSYPYQPFSYPYQSFGYTYEDTYSLAFGFNTGYLSTYMGGQRDYVIGGNGTLRLGFGAPPNLGISIALAAPPLPPASDQSQAYIYPTGVVNAASYAPYTSGISPGEEIAIFGSDLTVGGPPQVTINGVTAVVLGATATQVTAVVPNPLPPVSNGLYAQVQITNGQPSNIVWVYVNQTSPGIFTQAGNGLNDAQAYDSSNNPVTPTNPATPGQMISISTTGFGATTTIATPGTGLNSTSVPPSPSAIAVTIGAKSAKVSKLTVDPNNVGAVDVFVTVPSGVGPGEVALVIEGLDATNAQATIYVGAAPASPATSSSAAAQVRNPMP